MKALVGAFNQEKALVGAFSVIVKTNGSFAALLVTTSSSMGWSLVCVVCCVNCEVLGYDTLVVRSVARQCAAVISD